MPEDLTFDRLVRAIQARQGLLVKLTKDDPTRQHRRRRTVQGVVKPGLDHQSELLPEEDGSLVFRLARAEWYVLQPRLFTAASEDTDTRRLRIEMSPVTRTIETFAQQRQR